MSRNLSTLAFEVGGALPAYWLDGTRTVYSENYTPIQSRKYVQTGPDTTLIRVPRGAVSPSRHYFPRRSAKTQTAAVLNRVIPGGWFDLPRRCGRGGLTEPTYPPILFPAQCPSIPPNRGTGSCGTLNPPSPVTGRNLIRLRLYRPREIF